MYNRDVIVSLYRGRLNMIYEHASGLVTMADELLHRSLIVGEGKPVGPAGVVVVEERQETGGVEPFLSISYLPPPESINAKLKRR
jgi:hypothetical protein